MMKRSYLISLILLLGGVLLWLLLSWQPMTQERTTVAVAPAPQGGDFTLQSQDGPVALQDLRGKVVVIYFGYTWCPDVCPTSLSLLSAALNELTAEELSRFQALFISVDPERDDLQRLKEYGSYFHPSILGVTGDPETLKRVAAQYGAAYRVVKQDSAAGYLVDHSADLYVVDKKGRLVDTIHHGTAPEKILATLRKWLQQ